MAAKDGNALTIGDIALNVASMVLAFLSASFAGYMVVYGPPDGNGNLQPVNLALEPFDSSRTKLGTFDTVDPIVTGSITKRTDAGIAVNQATVESFSPEQHLHYKLRTILQDKALVDITSGQKMVTLQVEQGAVIPGAGRVLRFEKRDGKWIVVTNSSEISEDGMAQKQ